MATLTIGLLADTHIPHRLPRLPREVLDALAGVDLILHAGDVDDPAALEPLHAIAPVYAVRGNFHIMDLSDGGASLPERVELHLAGQRLLLIHGHRTGLLGFLVKSIHILALKLGFTDNWRLSQGLARRLAHLYPEWDIIVFGHSHRAYIEQIGSTLLINPGAVCAVRSDQPSVTRLRLGDGEPQIEIIPLSVACE